MKTEIVSSFSSFSFNLFSVEVCRLEAELEKMEKKFQDSQDALGKSEAFSHVLHQNDGNLKKSNKKLKLDVENLQKKLEAKNLLV